MVFLEYQACPFTREGKGWLFGRWVVFQETSPERWAELTMARMAARSGKESRGQALTTWDSSSNELAGVCESPCVSLAVTP